MTDNLHYEAAFEDALRRRHRPFLRVDEQRRAEFSGSRVKSFDFVVHQPDGGGWLVDVKGRKFPYDLPSGRHFWENWVTDDDVSGLTAWEGAFGPQFPAMFVFAYWLTLPGLEHILPSTHRFRDRTYAFLALPAALYRTQARRRSDRWGTVFLPASVFRSEARPVFPAADALPAAG